MTSEQLLKIPRNYSVTITIIGNVLFNPVTALQLRELLQLPQ